MIPILVLSLWLQLSWTSITSAQSSTSWQFMDDQGTTLMSCDSELHLGGELTPTNCKIEPGKSLDDLARAWDLRQERDYAAKKTADVKDEMPADVPDTGILTIQSPRCIQRPAADGCNTETVCDGVATSVTLVACMKQQFAIPNEPKPVDVPAVQVGTRLGNDCPPDVMCFEHQIPVYSCTDKSNVLLTSEDGKKHCIQF